MREQPPPTNMIEIARNYAPHNSLVNSLDPHGCTMLFYACINGHAGIARFLLNYGADPHIRNSDGLTPLVVARLRNDNQELIRILETAGAQ